MYIPEYVQDNETYKILGDFGIQMDNVILTRKTDLVVINNKMRTYHLIDVSVATNRRRKILKKQKIVIGLDLVRERKNCKHLSDSDTNCSWYDWNCQKMLRKKIGESENQSKNRDHQD